MEAAPQPTMPDQDEHLDTTAVEVVELALTSCPLHPRDATPEHLAFLADLSAALDLANRETVDGLLALLDEMDADPDLARLPEFIHRRNKYAAAEADAKAADKRLSGYLMDACLATGTDFAALLKAANPAALLGGDDNNAPEGDR